MHYNTGFKHAKLSVSDLSNTHPPSPQRKGRGGREEGRHKGMLDQGLFAFSHTRQSCFILHEMLMKISDQFRGPWTFLDFLRSPRGPIGPSLKRILYQGLSSWDLSARRASRKTNLSLSAKGPVCTLCLKTVCKHSFIRMSLPSPPQDLG